MDNEYTNTDNMQEQFVYSEPEPVHGWSWGAFMLPVSFSIGNGAYRTFCRSADPGSN